MGKRILIVGAGVIGSLYALRLHRRGADVTLLARGERLREIRANGLRYHEKGTVKSAPVRVIDKLEDHDIYDFVLVAVRYDQTEAALRSLATNQSPTIVTLANALHYDRFLPLVGARLLPGFPGGGGDIKDGILYANLIANTIFGEIDGSRSARVSKLAAVFEAAKLPCKISDDILAFHRTHAALVAPTRQFYENGKPVDVKTARNSRVLGAYADDIRSNMRKLDAVSPASMKILAKLPKWAFILMYKIMLHFSYMQDALLGNHAQGAYAEVALMNEELGN